MDTIKIKSELQRRLADLEGRLGKIEHDVSKTYSSDSTEQAQERENDEVLDQIGNETREGIAQIKSALQRITNDNYGICNTCGNEITEGRLAIIPESTLCISCAD